MKTAKDIQIFIFERTGLKTGVRKGKGSMKGYLIIYPIFQNGIYPSIPIDISRELSKLLIDFDHEPHPVFCTTSDISVFGLNNERAIYKKEAKPKIGENTPTWGSKNSQMRLDKAATRYAKRLRKGGCARYY